MKNARSLARNTIANYIGLGYTTIIGIVVFPLYLQYLGAEAFGLVGFFTVLQSWMQLLDMGMSPMFSRQVAQVRGQNTDFLELKKLLRSLELIILGISIIVILSVAIGSKWISSHWLNVASLPLTEVKTCIVLMGAVFGLRFFSSLYRSGIQGMEKQVRLNVITITLVSLRFIGALILLKFITRDVVYFFAYQLVISAIELLALFSMFYHSIPVKDKIGIKFFWNIIKPILPFAGGLAYASAIWIMLTQMDKIILSSILPLSEYGYFALVGIVAAGILQLAGPISQAILPRMTYLLSQGKEKDMLKLYRKSTRLMSVIMLPLTGMIALFSGELLFAWTGDRKAAEWAGPVLFWFALGNGILSLSAFQYYLQFAHGKLKIHVIFNTVSAIIQIPIIIYVAFKYGAMGVALTWFTLRLITFIIWTPIVHHIFAPGIHLSWLFKDITPNFLLTALLLTFVRSLNIGFNLMSRLEVFSTLLGIGLIVFILNALLSIESRRFIINMIKPAKLNDENHKF